MWTNVNDALPIEGIDVLVWATNECDELDSMYPCTDVGRRTKYSGHNGWDTNYDLTKYRTITHWMPLPDAPQGNKEDGQNNTDSPQCPFLLVERFVVTADNGVRSHWELVERSTGAVKWSQQTGA